MQSEASIRLRGGGVLYDDYYRILDRVRQLIRRVVDRCHLDLV